MSTKNGTNNTLTAILLVWLIALTGATAYIFVKSQEKPSAESLGFYPATITHFTHPESVENISGDSTEAMLQNILNGGDIEVKNEGEQMLIFAKALTTDVYVPTEFEFAGEKVPLHRNDIREAFTRELTANTYLHASTLQILRIFPRMSAQIIPILKEEGVPEDFVYLAVCESALNVLAVSPAKAAGLWQFMQGTAKEYNLVVNGNIDERYHIEKSTRAACQYLKKAKEKFGSWTAAAASYNCGTNGFERFRTKQQTNNYYDLLLSEETNRYVFRILAFKQILNNAEKYNFQIEKPYAAEPYTIIKVKGKISNLTDWAKKQGISYKTLKRFNPWLRENTLNVKSTQTTEIKIPVHKELYI